jgi:hypothetical protein
MSLFAFHYELFWSLWTCKFCLNMLDVTKSIKTNIGFKNKDLICFCFKNLYFWFMDLCLLLGILRTWVFKAIWLCACLSHIYNITRYVVDTKSKLNCLHVPPYFLKFVELTFCLSQFCQVVQVILLFSWNLTHPPKISII